MPNKPDAARYMLLRRDHLEEIDERLFALDSEGALSWTLALARQLERLVEEERDDEASTDGE